MNLKQSKFMKRKKVISRVLTSGIMIMGLSGCTVGPALYKTSFNEYNDAVRTTLDEQLLANLVRMRYLESPIFLQVSSLSTSFSVGANLGGTGTFPSGTANTLGANLGGSYSENPTISFSMPESRDYYGRLMAPLSAKQITALVFGGFDTELVFRTSVRGINGLKNQSADYKNSSKKNANVVRFDEALALITKLRSKGLVDIELGGKETSWSSPVKMNNKDLTSLSKVALLEVVIDALGKGSEVVEYGIGKDGKPVRGGKGLWQAHMFEKHMALRFAPASKYSSDAKRLKKLLGLKSNRYNYSIVEAELVNAEKARGVMGLSPGALDPRITWSEIGMRGRSMMEIMQVASKEVQVPSKDIERGVVTISTGTSDGLVIKSSASAPSNSSLRVKYRGNWFYIEDTDLKSRETFAMLTAVFAVVGGTVPGAHPVLTMPVK